MGLVTERFAQLGPTTGIDLSTEAVATARARCPHITFIAGNVYDSPLPAAHFDVVVSQEVLPASTISPATSSALQRCCGRRLPRAHLHATGSCRTAWAARSPLLLRRSSSNGL